MTSGGNTRPQSAHGLPCLRLRSQARRPRSEKAIPAINPKFSPEFIQGLHALFTVAISEGYNCPLLIDLYEWAMQQSHALERLDNKIEDLELAAKLRPPPAIAGNGAAEPQAQKPPQPRAEPPPRTGRRPGVVSEPYAGLLAALAANGAKTYNTGEIANLAKGLAPYWVDRSDLRVKEARPLILQKAYKAVEKPKAGNLIDKEYKLVESNEDDSAIANMLIRGDNLLARATSLTSARGF